MLRRFAILGLLGATLTGCSYGYDILAVARDGRLIFIVDPNSPREPSCFRSVEVVARDGAKAQPEAGDDLGRIGYGTFWSERVSFDDDCANTFPLTYGTTLQGQHETDGGMVKPKPLVRGTVYEISTTTGATGYGRGQFVVHVDGRIENVKAETGSPS